MYEVSVISRFSGAHRLKGYEGPCARLHGHNWEVEVFLSGSELDETGMLADFRQLKNTLKEVLSDLDHADLNNVAALAGRNPTSEILAEYIFSRLSGELDNERYVVSKVRVSETEGSSASYVAERSS